MQSAFVPGDKIPCKCQSVAVSTDVSRFINTLSRIRFLTKTTGKGLLLSMDTLVTDAVLAALEYLRTMPALVLSTLTLGLYGDHDVLLGVHRHVSCLFFYTQGNKWNWG